VSFIAQLFWFVLALVGLGGLIVLLHFWKHKWNYNETLEDLVDGSLTIDIAKEELENLELTKQAEMIGRKARPKETKLKDEQ